MKSHPLLRWCAALLLAGCTSLPALEITLPEEKARLAESPLPGYALAVTHCYTCHSTDYLRYQPTTTPAATWKAMVVKMQKTFGAAIPDAAIDPIAEYLTKTYGTNRSPAPAATGANPAGARRKAATPDGRK